MLVADVFEGIGEGNKAEQPSCIAEEEAEGAAFVPANVEGTLADVGFETADTRQAAILLEHYRSN